MSKKKPATTNDIKEIVEHMVEHGFNLNSNVLVYLGDNLYEITGMSHWHVEPQLQLEIQRVKDGK